MSPTLVFSVLRACDTRMRCIPCFSVCFPNRFLLCSLAGLQLATKQLRRPGWLVTHRPSICLCLLNTGIKATTSGFFNPGINFFPDIRKIVRIQRNLSFAWPLLMEHFPKWKYPLSFPSPVSVFHTQICS